MIHKGNQCDPQLMPARLIWYLATEGGAKSLGLEDVGRLAPGWQADLQLIDATLPTPLAEHNLYDQMLLYRNPSHVRAVMVAGETLVWDGKLIGVERQELEARTRAEAARLWSKTESR